MSEQGRLDLEPRVHQDAVTSTVTSTTDCGQAGALRVELVLVERMGSAAKPIEFVRLRGDSAHVPIEHLTELLRALTKAHDSSERRRARRAAMPPKDPECER